MMMPGRFFLGVGSGEALNEHVTGARWPETEVRLRMLDEAVAVDALDLTIRVGEFYALLGPNGAGKTTLFNMISGVLRPSGGRISFDGIDLATISPWKFAAVGIALALTFPFWITVNVLGSPDNGVILSGYIGSFLVAGAFLSVGSAVSALTRNQVIAFVLGVVGCFLFAASGTAVEWDEAKSTQLFDALKNNEPITIEPDDS